jgi:hypothetical protein
MYSVRSTRQTTGQTVIARSESTLDKQNAASQLNQDAFSSFQDTATKLCIQ